MGHNKYVRRLKQDVPVWVQHGWVKPGHESDILEHAAAQRPAGGHIFTYALSIFGVLLLGSGIISYFAANWAGMAKIVKLIVLFGGLWGAYLTAAWLHKDDKHPLVGQAILLLGVILFGANIFLIAQIYHIDSHFPNGVLMWSLGALLSAYLLRSQPAMVAAILLAMLWNSMETGYFRSSNWPFLLVWAAFLPRLHRMDWRTSLHLAIIALMLWSWLSAESLLRHAYADRLYLVQLYFLIYLSLFLGGMLLATTGNYRKYAVLVQRYSVVAVATTFYMLTSPHLQSGSRWFRHAMAREAASMPWLLATVLGLVLVVALALWHRQRSGHAQRPKYLVYGQGLIALTVLLILANLFFSAPSGGVVAIGFNLLFFAGIVWLVFAGLHLNDRFFVNLAFVFFAIGLISRYFDTFWTLLDRSFFFMAGGIVLIVGGYFLERQRRRLTGEMVRRRHGEVGE